MEYFQLGKSGIQTSRLCLGTMNFGMVSSAEEAFRILDCALDNGINFVDTSNSYGGYENRGASEKIIGEWIKNNPGKRNRIILSTKVYSCTEKEFLNPNDEKGLSGYKIRHHLEASLRRLQTDHVELYQLHHVDRTCDYDGIWDALQREYLQGKIECVGTSNFPAHELVMFQYSGKAKHMLGVVSEQHRYNLLHRLAELEVIPATKKLGISILAWGPLDAGRLSENAFSPSPNARCSHNTITEMERTQIIKFQKLCAEVGAREQTLAMAWLLWTGVDGIVIGPRNEGQLQGYISAMQFRLTTDIVEELNKIFPPIGIAPEAYAW